MTSFVPLVFPIFAIPGIAYFRLLYSLLLGDVVLLCLALNLHLYDESLHGILWLKSREKAFAKLCCCTFTW